MPASLWRRLALCLVIALPALTLRLSGVRFTAVVDLVIFGAAVVAAAFILAWAAEAAQKDISGALAIAILALIAVLPEYAVDLFYAFRSGSDPSYTHYAAANMTGSNRLLLGFGWPLVVLTALWVMRKVGRSRSEKPAHFLMLDKDNRLEIGFLFILGIIAFAIPLMGGIPIWFGIILVLFFVAYLVKAGGQVSEEEELIGTAALIGDLPEKRRRIIVVSLFLASATVILLSAEPFAESLVDAGSTLGIDSYFLVQWLAPLSSEAPEFIIALMFALRGKGAAALGTLIASKVNQWSLLVGSLPIAHYFGGGTSTLPLDARQIEEFTLTATQTLLGVSIILALRFHWSWAIGLFVLFSVQFAVTGTEGRYVLSAIHMVLALILFWRNRRDITPALKTMLPRERNGVTV